MKDNVLKHKILLILWQKKASIHSSVIVDELNKDNISESQIRLYQLCLQMKSEGYIYFHSDMPPFFSAWITEIGIVFAESEGYLLREKQNEESKRNEENRHRKSRNEERWKFSVPVIISVFALLAQVYPFIKADEQSSVIDSLKIEVRRLDSLQRNLNSKITSLSDSSRHQSLKRLPSKK